MIESVFAKVKVLVIEPMRYWVSGGGLTAVCLREPHRFRPDDLAAPEDGR